jgi:transcriptional regulator with XRE-family HTH domain
MPKKHKPPIDSSPIISRSQRAKVPETVTAVQAASMPHVNVGQRLRELRTSQGLSSRTLAQLSGLNVNTLSLIENGRSSPSVNTLQQLAAALQIPLILFFEVEKPRQRVAHQKSGERSMTRFKGGHLENLASGLQMHVGQPLQIVLEPGTDSGPTPIVHTGQEFVFCLEGVLTYTVDGVIYHLNPGDSLVFESHLPHSWGNYAKEVTRSLLILCASDENDHPARRHFGTAPE